MWNVEYTDEFGAWFASLGPEQQEAVAARVRQLEYAGPGLRRPTVGAIKSSAFAPRMKELRCNQDGSLRLLFIFDPRRTAILLLGGDKTDRWNAWYRTAVPEADALYRVHLEALRAEGLL
jgi:hypothetical protein